MFEAGEDPHFEEEDDIEYIFNFFIDNDDTEKVEYLLNHYLSKSPYSGFIYHLWAQYYQLNDNTADALDKIQMALSFEPNNIDYIITEAVLLDLEGKTSQAIEILRYAENIETGNKSKIHYTLGKFYFHQNKHKTAFYYLNLALKENADEFVPILYEIAITLEQGKLIKNGIDFFEKICDEYPMNAECWDLLSHFYKLDNNNAKAKTALEFAVAINDKDSMMVFQYTNLLVEMNLNEEALTYLIPVFETDDTNLDFAYSIGVCYENMELYELALQWYTKCIKLNSKLTEAWFSAGVCYYELKKIKEAKSKINKAMLLSPGHTEHHYFLALCYIEDTKFEQAKVEFEKSLELDPYNLDALLDYENMLTDNCDEEGEALQLLLQYKTYFEDEYEFLYRLAGKEYVLGFESESFIHLSAALTINFEAYNLFFEYLPNLVFEQKIWDLINFYKNAH